MASHSRILAWRVPWTEGAWRATVRGAAESDTPERLNRKYLEHLFLLLCIHSHNLFYITATCAPQSQKRPAKDAL